jgi:hypothetical protein
LHHSLRRAVVLPPLRRARRSADGARRNTVFTNACCTDFVHRVVVVLAALGAALALTAGSAAPAPGGDVSYAYGARSEAPAMRLQSGQLFPGFTGGPVTAADGETVNVYVQDELLAADPGVPQRFADLLASLLHGSELSTLTLDLATLDRVRQICGFGALGCYSPRAMTIVAIGEDLRSIAARSVVTHEYGHHLANSRTNDPWPAVDWGTKRWASYVNICKRAKGGELFPGDEAEHYQFNPGEDFAENYRVLNERRAGVPEMPWQVVDASLYPDQPALDLLAQDITTPWTGPTTSTVRSSFGPRATGRGFRIQTPLDGNFTATLRSPAGARFTLRVVDLATGGQLAYAATATPTKTVSLQICGERTLQLQVKRVRGSGPFTLTFSQP